MTVVSSRVAPARPRSPWSWVGGLLVLGGLVAGLMVAAVVLWRVIDVDAMLVAASADPPAPVVAPVPPVPLSEPTVTDMWTAYLYESALTADFFPESDYYPELVGRWAALLRSVGADVRRASGAPAVDRLKAGDLLVVPAGVCLRYEEREAIWSHIERGGHLVASWALGVRDDDCNWLGYRFLQDLTETKLADAVEERAPMYVALPRGSALAAGPPPGVRIELKTEPWLGLASETAGAFWSDWALNPLSLAEGGSAGAAITRVAKSGGRIAWFGYRVDVGAGERDRRLVNRIAQNALLWASGHILADLEPWPNGYRAAMTVTQDVEHNFQHSRHLAERFRELGVPATFYVVTQLALEHPELAEILRSAGELGSHSVDHRQVGGHRWSTQLIELRQARADIQSWAGVEALGFRPPREVFDLATLETWRRLGGLYLATFNDPRSAGPEIFATRFGPIVVMPRVVDDDYAVMVVRNEPSPDSLRAAFRAALEKVRWLGGLDYVSLHTQLIDSNRRVAAVASVVESAQAHGDVWIAEAWKLADWWLRRSALELRVRERWDGSAILKVRNGGEQALAEARIHVYLPEDELTYAAPEVGAAILRSEYVKNGLRLDLPTLGPGASLEILLPRRKASAEELQQKVAG